MPFCHRYRVRFADTDAAGVVFFARVLTICHNAYEASLVASGIDLRPFFSSTTLAVPIVHAACDFKRPLYCGDEPSIILTPTQQSASSFIVRYDIVAIATPADSSPASSEAPPPPLAQAETRHVAIDPQRRQRVDLPPSLLTWIEQWGHRTP